MTLRRKEPNIKKVLLALLMLLVLLSLSGCGLKLESGTVIEKKHTPMHMVVQYMPAGKVIIPHYITVPEEYKIYVRGTDEEGAVKTEWWSLDAAAYSRIHIGMKVNREVRSE